jgi:tetratricopeptide (TPR) repeat protein
MNPDQLAELEEERRFLLRSIADLEREHEAGDVDDHDFEVLRDGYIARAAATMHSIEDGRRALPTRRRRRPMVVGAWIVGVIAIATVAGVLVARSSGQRTPGGTMTGIQPGDEVAIKLAEARSLMQAGDLGGAFERFREATELEPDNVEARTYTAWILVLNSRSMEPSAERDAAIDAALTTFAAVTADEPGYADAHCLYAVASANFLDQPDLDTAREQGQLCLESNPPAGMVQLVTDFLAGLDATSPSAPSTT